MGALLPDDVVRALMLLRAERADPSHQRRAAGAGRGPGRLLNAGVVPWVPEQGSVGASGDLAPLSHMALALMGEGQVVGPERPSAGRRGADRGRARPVPLRAQGGDRVHQRHPGADRDAGAAGARRARALAHRGRRRGDEPRGAARHAGAARSADSRGPPAPRPDRGRGADAARCSADSEIRESHRENDDRVQDAYSLRCAPQVLGAVADAIRFVAETVRGRAERVHRQPAGLSETARCSRAATSTVSRWRRRSISWRSTLTTLQAIAERRVERLVNPDLSQGLPAFLTGDPGLSSGYMMVQITAASLVAESRTLAMPASIGSIPTDANQEDFVPDGDGGGLQGPADPRATPAGWSAPSCSARRRGSSSSSRCGPGGGGRLYAAAPGLQPPVVRHSEADRPPGARPRAAGPGVAEGELDPGADQPAAFLSCPYVSSDLLPLYPGFPFAARAE